MKKTELKIKDIITLKDKIRAIEAISDSCFVDGDYTPYFLESNTIEYMAIYFIEGFELEAGDDLYSLIMGDSEFNSLIMKFFWNEDLTDEENQKNMEYISIQNFVSKNVATIVDYRKQRMIHCADIKENLFKSLDEIGESIVQINDNLAFAAKPVLENPDFAKKAISVLSKLDEKDVVNKEAIVDIVMDIAKKSGAFRKPKNLKKDLHVVENTQKTK